MQKDFCEKLKIVKQKAIALNLPLKVITIQRDTAQNLIVYFEAENRVDFRDFVKELNDFFKEPVRLEQIGPRDTVKKIGGIGICGQKVCCHRFLPEFKSITSDILTVQGLKQSTSYYTGLCGRLMCCLSFECPLEKLQALKEKKAQKKAKLAQKKADDQQSETTKKTVSMNTPSVKTNQNEVPLENLKENIVDHSVIQEEKLEIKTASPASKTSQEIQRQMHEWKKKKEQHKRHKEQKKKKIQESPKKIKKIFRLVKK